MKVIHELPPNYAEIIVALPIVAQLKGVMFCYGDVIYAPGSPRDVPEHLMAHEKVHSVRQLDEGIDKWWQAYLRDPEYRLLEELLAHRAEYRYLTLHGNRKERRAAAAFVGKRLAHPMYGRLINQAVAVRLIKHEAVFSHEARTEQIHPTAQPNQAPAQAGGA